VNGDGKVDVIATAFTSSKLAVFLGKGDGTLSNAAGYACGAGPYDVAIADVTGDGKPDLVTAETMSLTAGVLKNNGDGTFGANTGFAAGSQPWSIAAGDLNMDGANDLVVANNYGDGSVSVLVNRGAGIFSPPVDYTVGAIDLGTAWWVEVADLDRDGKLDIAVAGGDSDSVALLLNKGDGTFDPARAFPTGSNPGSIAVGDLDRDARIDIITTTLDTTTATILHSTCM
jgi:hypothetical protein